MPETGERERVSQKSGPKPDTLHSHQALFVRCLAKLFAYAEERGYELTLGEGFVKTPRKARRGPDFWLVDDAEHMPNSMHYCGLACDLNLFVRGEYITRSDHFAWYDLGSFWEGLNPLCAWGGRFKPADGNHVSIRWQGRA